MKDYEVIVLGGGPGGYLAAERAAGRGKKVLLIEEEHLGGVCLNHGCIPTKTLLNAAKLYHQMSNSERYGVSCAGAKFDLIASLKWKQKVVEKLRSGIVYQMKRHGVEVIHGRGELMSAREVRVDGKTFGGQALIIATGSSAVRLPIPGVD